MLAQLKAAGVAEKAAMVLDEKRWQARQQAIRSGMPATDAEEQATREWLLQEPENEKNPDQPLRALISG